MSCSDDVERRIKHAENVIKDGKSVDEEGKSVDYLWNEIDVAIYNCAELGNTEAKNNLMLIVDYHLEQYYRHAEPEVKSLDELRNCLVPKAPKITWRH